VKATTHFADPKAVLEASEELGEASPDRCAPIAGKRSGPSAEILNRGRKTSSCRNEAASCSRRPKDESVTVFEIRNCAHFQGFQAPRPRSSRRALRNHPERQEFQSSWKVSTIALAGTMISCPYDLRFLTSPTSRVSRADLFPAIGAHRSRAWLREFFARFEHGFRIGEVCSRLHNGLRANFRSLDLKIPETTKTASAPSARTRAASAGVAIPPAEKFGTGSFPVLAI